MKDTSKKNNDLISREDIETDEGQVSIFTYPNAIIRVHFPNITPEENARRMKRIETAAAELLKDVLRRKRK